MPQFSMEVSWVELFKLVLWWATIFASFHVGRSHGYQKIPEGPKDSKVDELKAVPPQVSEVKDGLPQVFMCKNGKLLHIQGSCRYQNEVDVVAMNWCSTCKKLYPKSSKIA